MLFDFRDPISQMTHLNQPWVEKARQNRKEIGGARQNQKWVEEARHNQNTKERQVHQFAEYEKKAMTGFFAETRNLY